jgi:aminoglycoside/choline kinase family phosphotransferase
MGGNQEALTAILDLALDTLQPWQQFTDAQIPPYTEDRLMMEFDLCAEWFAASLISLPPSMQDEITLAATRSTLIDAMLEQPQVCVHRDYHCRNLLLTGEARNRRIGIVDFQDALIGPVLYDVASLLQDCYALHDKAVIAAALHRFGSMSPLLTAIAPEQIAWWHDACAIQRQIKAVGIFARLHLRDGKSSHLHYIPAVLARAAALAATHEATLALSPLLIRWAEEAATNPLLAKSRAT